MRKKYYIIKSEHYDGTHWVIWADAQNEFFVPRDAIRITKEEAFKCVDAARNNYTIDGRIFSSRFLCPADWDGHVANYVQKGCMFDRKR
ncbi:MAG: hypothetical protein LUI05_05875 [Oscillospiraceae bacterium]|nr:hypothetical protein [Oscillospiraceae bacterium]